ncbi:MAG TPA: hypothetical protein VII92_15175 [Anaerolineae bacterium]
MAVIEYTERNFALPIAAFLAFGLFLFLTIHRWQRDYEADFEAIERGESTRILLTVERRYMERQPTDNSTSYVIVLSDGKNIHKTMWPGQAAWEKTHVGQTFEAHVVNGRVRVPALEPGRFVWGKLASAALGVAPIVIVAIMRLYHRFARRSPKNAAEAAQAGKSVARL